MLTPPPPEISDLPRASVLFPAEGLAGMEPR
jgi:hypothetical protein